MTLEEYDKWCRPNDFYKKDSTTLAMHTLGLCGEAGEFADKVKKQYRDGNFDKKAAAYELGDALWYWVALCGDLGYTPTEVLLMNVEKLTSRRDRGVMRGSGDNR